MDPLPSVNRVFSLLAQEEKQKPISNDSQQTVAFLAKANQNQQRKFANNNRNGNRERPFCSHCKLQVHTIDKCYKLHGYPPGYKPKSKTNFHVAAIINENVNGKSDINDSLSNMFRGFSQEQCQQVLSALSSHMISVNPNEETSSSKCYSISIKHGSKSS